MVLRCDLCRIEVPDGLLKILFIDNQSVVFLEHVLVEHKNGKRHQALLTARERFETSQNSSIYITRIKPEHNETILKDFFSRFGEIKNCFIDKEKVCIHLLNHFRMNSVVSFSMFMLLLNMTTSIPQINVLNILKNVNWMMEHV
jgi:RNA recognition motif-containing protein